LTMPDCNNDQGSVKDTPKRQDAAHPLLQQ
jgi:hypothetical protein